MLLVYLLSGVDRSEYEAFWKQPKRWELLILAQCAALLAVLISILRWRRLVEYFEIPFTAREALRLGFLGYLLNFVAPGSVGGDLFKAVLVAKNKPTKKPEAVASVLLDRAIGLLGLVILAWLAFLSSPRESLPQVLIAIGYSSGIVSIASVAVLLVTVFAGGWFDAWILWMENRLPWIGSGLARMLRAVRLLRKSPKAIPILIVSSVAVHGLMTYCVCLVSWGIYPDSPSMRQHFMVIPPGMAAGALPITPGGIGIQEGAIVGLFRSLPQLPESYSPVLVAALYRLMTIAIAGVGIAYYVASHGKEWQEMQQAYQEAGT